jgi:hypothetical protein
MHKIVLGLAGVMSLFVITIPLAMLRVSATQKFAGQPLKSQTCAAHTPVERKVLSQYGSVNELDSTDEDRERTDFIFPSSSFVNRFFRGKFSSSFFDDSQVASAFTLRDLFIQNLCLSLIIKRGKQQDLTSW